MPEPALRLRGLRAGYGRADVVAGIDLTVPSGSTVALLGPNGAGKTTLLRAVVGELRPRAGSVEVDGVDVTGVSPHVLARAGVCLVGDRDVFSGLTVEDNLRMHSHGLPGLAPSEAVAMAVATFPELAPRRRQPAATLSGGEQQMLAVARAMVSQPRLLLLDEISTGLAPLVIDRLYEAVSTLAAGGCAVLVVEQFVDRAVQLAEFVVVLSGGRVAFVGEPAEMTEAEMTGAYLGAEALR